MRDNRFLFAALSGPAVLMAARAGAASACLPPPPGWVPPTEEERVRSGAQWATDIVYGEVTRGSGSGGTPRFRILHVYKGSLRPGMTINADTAWGLDAPMCAGMIMPPPVVRGRRGVIFFSGRPELKFLSDRELELMIACGFIQARPADDPRPR